MVEIKQDAAQPVASSSNVGDEEESKYRLLYSKSKVYVNPTAYARDNIPGFVALVKRVSMFGCYPLCISNIDLGCGEPKLPVSLDTRTSTEREGSN